MQIDEVREGLAKKGWEVMWIDEVEMPDPRYPYVEVSVEARMAGVTTRSTVYAARRVQSSWVVTDLHIQMEKCMAMLRLPLAAAGPAARSP